MFDMHYDLLTILYWINMKKPIEERLVILEKIKKFYNKNNIIGGCINLYFMGEEQMEKELNITKEELKNVPKMLEKSISFLNQFVETLDYKPFFCLSIEGLDYINNINELDELYSLGVRSVIPFWNNDNKFGGGTNGNLGLTQQGVELIDKLIELNIVIDLSHANEKTFYDIVDYLKEKNYQNVMLSHSNCYSLCAHKRNIKDNQIKRLNDINGKFGLVMYNRFILENSQNYNRTTIEKQFLKHVEHLFELGVNEDNIFLSTDDMTFMNTDYYNDSALYNISNVKDELKKLLNKKFKHDIIEKIICKNGYKFIIGEKERRII